MKSLPHTPRLLALLLAPVMLLTSCASDEDLRAALHDYNEGQMSYDVRRKSQAEARMERTDTKIQHMQFQ